MDIQSFMKPLPEVVFAYDDLTVKEALVVLKKYRYQSIPVIDRKGRYIGSLSEGDLLYAITDAGEAIEGALAQRVGILHRNREYVAISVHASVNSLIGKAADENFVPIVDDTGILLGIVTRKTLLNYFFEHQFVVL